MADTPKGTKKTGAQREDLMFRAYKLALEGLSAPAIGEKLGVSEKTVDTYLRTMRAAVHRRRVKEQRYDLEEFIAAQKAISAEMWQWLRKAHALLGTAADRAAAVNGQLAEMDGEDDPDPVMRALTDQEVVLRLRAEGLDPAALANTASVAWDRIAKALGLYTTKVEHGASRELLEQLLKRPVVVEVPGVPDCSEFEDG